MKATIEHQGKSFRVNLNNPLDISIPLASGPGHVSAWYVNPIQIEPVRSEAFTGSVAEGGSVNFRNIFFNPHGHGTHTESVGHIAKEVYSVNNVLKRFFTICKLHSVPLRLLEKNRLWMQSGDLVITETDLPSTDELNNYGSIVLRTIPNNSSKIINNYSAQNPAYLLPESMEIIAKSSIQHLLIDLPSVDRESDEGRLTCHRIFWNYPEEINLRKTITEMIFVPDSIPDGDYLLELQMAPFENDASPSRPVLYKLEPVS